MSHSSPELELVNKRANSLLQIFLTLAYSFIFADGIWRGFSAIKAVLAGAGAAGAGQAALSAGLLGLSPFVGIGLATLLVGNEIVDFFLYIRQQTLKEKAKRDRLWGLQALMKLFLTLATAAGFTGFILAEFGVIAGSVAVAGLALPFASLFMFVAIAGLMARGLWHVGIGLATKQDDRAGFLFSGFSMVSLAIAFTFFTLSGLAIMAPYISLPIAFGAALIAFGLAVGPKIHAFIKSNDENKPAKFVNYIGLAVGAVAMAAYIVFPPLTTAMLVVSLAGLAVSVLAFMYRHRNHEDMPSNIFDNVENSVGAIFAEPTNVFINLFKFVKGKVSGLFAAKGDEAEPLLGDDEGSETSVDPVTRGGLPRTVSAVAFTEGLDASGVDYETAAKWLTSLKKSAGSPGLGSN